MLYSPIHSAVVRRMRHLVVSAKGNPAAVSRLVTEAKARIDAGRSVLIFPEGTRTSVIPFSTPNYKRGVVAMYKALNVSCVPIAINSGLFWPPKSFLRFPGKVIIEILPPIAPGLSAPDFVARLARDLESNSQRLVDEALRSAQLSRRPIYQLARPPRSVSR
jgi:1-acyl-sn-glycerol-3-phosphate acyltransferase